MAGDWIKVEKGTPFKAKMAILAKRLGVSLGEAFLSFFRLYAWADGVTADGTVPNLSLQDGDTLSGALPGTCAALASAEIGWLAERDDALEFVNWDRHNGKSAKQRVYERERKRRQRSTSRERPELVGTNAGTTTGTKKGPIEKRREEKNTASAVTPLPPLPAILDREDFRDALAAWLAYKVERREAYKPSGLSGVISQAEKRAQQHGVSEVIEAMEVARGNGWEGWNQSSSFSNGRANDYRRDNSATAKRILERSL